MKLIFIVLAVLTGIYDLVLNVIRYRSANNPTPENMADVYDAETYVKWKKYSAEQSRLAILTSIISCVIEVALLATNAYSAFASLFGEHPITQLFAIILLVTAVNFVTGVVRSYIMNMVIEQKYGFNKTTIKTFITDCIRDLILNFGLSFGLACLIYGVYGALGAWMILVFAAVVFAFTMVMSFLYPIFSRIGNKFTPLEDGELKDKLLALLERHQVTLVWVKGHDGHPYNERCDKLATAFADSFDVSK